MNDVPPYPSIQDAVDTNAAAKRLDLGTDANNGPLFLRTW